MADDFDEMNDLIGQSPVGSGKVLFTPWLNGERTPVDDHTIRGGWNNLSLSTTRADLVRSVFEGVAYNSRWLLDTVERFVKRRMDDINFIGGGARSDIWCQMHADVLDRTIRQVAEPQHANARGAAFVAWLALGLTTPEALNRAVRIDAEFRPDPARPSDLRRAVPRVPQPLQGRQGHARPPQPRPDACILTPYRGDLSHWSERSPWTPLNDKPSPRCSSRS